MARPTLREGDRGPDVVTLQTCLRIPADGIFGKQTKAAVIKFQQDEDLEPDGIVGPKTWKVLEEVCNLPPPEPPPQSGLSSSEVASITNLARASAIQKFNWPGRGIMPPGCVKGLAIAYACAYRKFHAGHPAFKEMAKSNTHNADKDVMAWEAGRFTAQGMNNNTAGINVLRHLYAYIFGLSMRESSGRHCEGRDMSANWTSAITAEAGLLQTSWNIRGGSGQPTLMQGLFDEYRKGAEGYMSIFKEGVFCSAANWKNWGTGDGAIYQRMSKEQPMFHVEVTAIGMRNLRKHWGPINRRDVAIRKEANTLLLEVEGVVAVVA
jgi:hypothetical protein